MYDYLSKFDNCLEGTIPYCTGACPFNMEILNFMEKARRGSAKASFNVYRNAVGFPRIVSHICPHPCQDVCPRKDHGGALQMSELEKASIALTKNTAPTDYNIPPKEERIAIIGAGAAGIGALLRLSTKKYHVTVFEKSDKMGGYLRQAVDPDIVDMDIDEQLSFQDYEIHFNTKITSIADLDQYAGAKSPGKENSFFDAIIVATGDEGEDFSLLTAVSEKGDKYCMESDGCGLFAVGGLIGQDLINSVAAGLAMGTVVDNYLKTGHQYYPEYDKPTALCDGMVTINSDLPSVIPASDSYSKEEFIEEASRCAECKCSYCRQHCDLCEYADKWPLRIKDEVVATTLEGKTELKATPARRLMSLCNQCGLCKEVCPEDVDMDTLFMVGRQKMFRQGKMPWAFHDYYRRDMEHANKEASLIRKPLNPSSGKEFEKCSYAFFPGCQLGAAEPEIVVKAYDSLLFQHPDTAIFLQCCGIAAEWEGDTEGFKEVLDDISIKWESLGRPVMILACMTCYKKFKENLPHIPIISLYEIMLSLGISGGCNSADYSIFNPCTARHETEIRQAVKELASNMGVRLHPLKENEEYAKCCGYGGHGDIANKAYSDFVARKRIEDGKYPYITYCINCRDIFKTHGKDAVHILELIFGMGNGDREASALPTITERWRNRIELKKTLLELFWNETMEEKDKMFGITLVMSDAIKEKLNKKHIFEHDIAQVVDFCQRTGRTIINTETGTSTGYLTVGYTTYWVEYKSVDEENKVFEIINAYSHRLKIELEAVWNGVKTTDEV